jgi:hypothetical protein
VSNKNHVLVLNGNKYDASTGKLIHDPKNTPPAMQSPTAAPRVLDGFTRRKPAHHAHKKTERSKTLMRGTVDKPRPIRFDSKTSIHTLKPVHKEQAKAIVGNSNPLREIRSRQINKSVLISKFGLPITNVKHSSAVLPVASPPPETAAQLSIHQNPPIAPVPAKNLFHSAMQNAKSHEEKRVKKPKTSHRVAKKLRISPKLVNAGASLAVVLVLGGYFTYQNIPNLSMRVAYARSGVNGGLPKYKPAGFALKGPIRYQPGQISITFRSNSDERNFQLTQRNSQWNSETLLANFVSTDRRPYQTYQDKGKTIYIYDDNNATWISNGIWYQVEGNSSLNSDQLLRIAGSL